MNNPQNHLLKTALQHHNSGNLAEAENLYRQILKADPKNSDALHLLGLIAHQVGKADLAINFIKQAIAANNNVCHYHSNVGNMLLEQEKTEEAIEHYNRAISINPKYAEAHNNLSNALKKQGKLNEAIDCLKRAIFLKQDYTDAHLNLGIAQKETGDLGKAAQSYKTAIALNPRMGKAHLNLGVIYQELGDYEKAAECNKNAIDANPDYADAYNNLGNSLRRLGLLDESINNFEKALLLNPSFAEACTNAGNALLEAGEIDKAIEQYEKAVSINPHHETAKFSRAIARFFNAPISEWNSLCENLLKDDNPQTTHKHDYLVRLAIYHLTVGDFAALEKTLGECKKISDSLKNCPDKDFKNMFNFERFLSLLLLWHKQNRQPKETKENIAIIGDSHCLSYSNTVLDGHKIRSNLIMGCKAWHLAKNGQNLYKKVLERIIDGLPARSECMFALGEIDCRYNEGISLHQKKRGGDLRLITEKTVKGYVKYAAEVAKRKNLDVTFIGVPAPCADGFLNSLTDFTNSDAERVVSVTRLFNDALKCEAASLGCGFADVYSLTVGQDGQSNGLHHMDNHHLKPYSLVLALESGLFRSAL